MLKKIIYCVFFVIISVHVKADLPYGNQVADIVTNACAPYADHSPDVPPDRPGWIYVGNVGTAAWFCNPYGFDPDYAVFVGARDRGDGWVVAYWQYTKFHVGLTTRSPAPSCPLKNPIDAGYGSKLQYEIDIPARGEGQISFSRFYNNANPLVFSPWYNIYQMKLIFDAYPNIINSHEYNNRDGACSQGWNEIKSQAADVTIVNSTGVKSADGNTCLLMSGGVIVGRIGIARQGASNPTLENKPVQLLQANGSLITFYSTGFTKWESSGTEQSTLEWMSNVGKWRHVTREGVVEEYSKVGKLLTITSVNGVKQILSYDTNGFLTKVQDSLGGSLKFVVDPANMMLSVTTDDNKITSFTYGLAGLITDVKRPDNTHRLYHYEDSRFPNFLTGVTDERGIRYASWSYDAQGRAISSQHSGGVDAGTFTYNADGSTTLTDTLGKKTIYHFATIMNERRVTSVEGQPTANCVGANKNYTYTPEGWLASKTDWAGNQTTYLYNTKGQETSRTEAAGTPVAKTITTEWHATLNLKTKITEPDKETTYIYDANGLLASKKIHSLAAQ